MSVKILYVVWDPANLRVSRQGEAAYGCGWHLQSRMRAFVIFVCLVLVNLLGESCAFLGPQMIKRSSNLGFRNDLVQLQPSKVSAGSARVGTRMQPLRDLLGLGPAEIAITLVVALVLFGPETLKSLSKDVGKAAAELKEIPKTFKEGMDEGAESSQVAKMKAIAAEKRKKRDEKVGGRAADDDDDDDAPAARQFEG